MSQNAQTIITAAMQEINAVAPGESPTATELAFGLDKLNRLVDGLNAERLAIPTVNFAQYTLVPNLSPHTIGPSGNSPTPTFICSGTRPTKIVGANLVINTSTPSYSITLNIRDADWWLMQSVQGLTTTYPTDLYYEPDWANGSLYFWPVPTTAYPVQLETWSNLGTFSTLSSVFTLPPGYWDMIVYNLAVSLLPSYGKASDANAQVLISEARKTKASIKSLNAVPPRIATGGGGLPSGGTPRPSFNWRTGFNV
jgi:hypothetical protein